MDLEIRGAGQLVDLGARLKAQGETGKGLRRELYRGINRATKPLKDEARAAAASQLPQRGGLAARVAKQGISTKTRSGGNTPGVRLVGKSSALTDKGLVRHPTFGRGPMVTQQIKGAGWFSETMKDGAPRVRRELLDVMRDVANRIEH